MTTETALAPTQGQRQLALLKAVGLDRLHPEQRELALHIAQRYDLDLMLRHLVMIEGRPYITRDGLLHVAHRSGVLDGIEVTEPELGEDGFWRATASVYRRDMSRPFRYQGRYPAKGANARFAPEMAIKVAEVMALRRAFDVSAPTVEERWDMEEPEPPAPKPRLAERVAARVAEVEAPQSAPEESPDEDDGSPTADAPAGRRPACFADPARYRAHAQHHRQVGDDWWCDRCDGMSREEFLRRLAEGTVPRSLVSAVARELYPEAAKLSDLSDVQRAEVWALAEERAGGGGA